MGTGDPLVTWCPASSEPTSISKLWRGSEDCIRHPCHGKVGEDEILAVMHSLSNNVFPHSRWLDFFPNILNWIYNFVEAFKAVGVNPAKESLIFKAATHNLWDKLFDYMHSPAMNETDEDDRRLMVVLSWLLPTGQGSSHVTLPLRLGLLKAGVCRPPIFSEGG